MLAFIMFDPMYFLIVGPAMLLAMWAQYRVKSAYGLAQRYRASSGMSGAQAARRILDRHDLGNVGIEQARGFLGDHYDPRARMLRLSPDVYSGHDLAAVGIAAHEAGHAIQHGVGYAPLSLRNAIVPLASFGSRTSIFIFIGGMILSSITGRRGPGPVEWGMGQYLMVGALILFSITVFFQLVNLPVEFDASARARKVLVSCGVIAEAEDPPVAKVLNAAALTYVAATLSAILTLLYLLLRSGLLGGRRD
jgi:Zn-dependent membrane protease YugP